MSKIYVKYISDETLETLRLNQELVNQNFIQYPNDSSWLQTIADGKTYIEKKFVIEDFSLRMPLDSKDKKVDLENSIILYEHLKDLPKYVLTDERFWNWINFDKGYEVALKMMPIQENSSVFKDHWLFTQGNRRGLFFGVLSRCFFRVALTVDESKGNPYELTEFVVNNPERFRNLSWRAFSNQRHIVQAVLKAEKQLLEEYQFEDNSLYPEIAKYVSMMGSVMLIDAMDEESIRKHVYRELEKMLQKRLETLFDEQLNKNQ